MHWNIYCCQKASEAFTRSSPNECIDELARHKPSIEGLLFAHCEGKIYNCLHCLSPHIHALIWTRQRGPPTPSISLSLLSSNDEFIVVYFSFVMMNTEYSQLVLHVSLNFNLLVCRHNPLSVVVHYVNDTIFRDKLKKLGSAQGFRTCVFKRHTIVCVCLRPMYFCFRISTKLSLNHPTFLLPLVGRCWNRYSLRTWNWMKAPMNRSMT